MDMLAQEIQKTETQEKKRKAFGEFIGDLNKRLKNKEISMEEWRNRRDNWKFE